MILSKSPIDPSLKKGDIGLGPLSVLIFVR